MPFKASNLIPEQAFNRARNVALNLKSYCSAKSAIIQSSGMNANDLMGVLETLKQASTDLSSLKSTPGLAQYAKDQENDQAYDVAAEFLSLEALVNDAITNLVSSLPVDSNGYLLVLKFDGINKDWRIFTAGQLTSIKSDIDAIVVAVI